MARLIEVPDILPNNMKQIRKMRRITVSEMAETLSFKNSYISVIENYKINMSGKLAFKIMGYLNVNFEQLFDMRNTMKVPFSVKLFRDIIIDINIYDNYLDLSNNKNVIQLNKEIKNKLKENGEEGKLFKFEVLHISKIAYTDSSNVILNATLQDNTMIEKSIDMNLLDDINHDLFVKLNERNFINKEEFILDKKKFDKSQNEILLNHLNIIIDRYLHSTNSLDIKDNYIGFKHYEDKSVESVNITIVYECINNIKYIEECLEMTPNYVAETLEISNESYNKLIKGELELSTKLMWKLVKLFKVPLELIINIPVYLKMFVTDKDND